MSDQSLSDARREAVSDPLHSSPWDSLDPATKERVLAEDRKAKARRMAEGAGLTIVPESGQIIPYEVVEAVATKPGIKSSEMWLAALLPLIVGAVVQLGWLSEQAATELGMVGGGSYVLGRSLVKGVMEWRKR